MYKKVVFFSILIIVFSGCMQKADDLSLTPIPKTPTKLLPTNTLTAIPSPTATPTPEMPIKIGTAYPVSEQPIDSGNIRSVREVAVLQNGHGITRFTQDLETLFIADCSGVTVCQMALDEKTRTIIPCQEVIDHYDISIRTNEQGELISSDFVIAPDGDNFLIVTDSGSNIVDREGNLLGSIPTPDSNFMSALSPNGDYVTFITVNDKKIKVYDVASGEVVFNDEGYTAQFSPDGLLFAVQKSMAINIYSVLDWTIAFSFAQDLNASWDFTADKKMIATVDKGELFFRQLSDGKVIRNVRRFKDGDYVLSENGDYALKLFITPSSISKYEAEVELWNTKTGEIYKKAGIEMRWLCDNPGVYLSYILEGCEFRKEMEMETDWYCDNETQGQLYVAKECESLIDWYSDDPNVNPFEVIDIEHLAVDDLGKVYHLYMERPWKAISESQKFYFTEEGQILLRTTYPDDPYDHNDEFCMITPYLKIVCSQISGKTYFLDADGKAYIKGISEQDSSVSILQVRINPNLDKESAFHFFEKEIDIFESFESPKYSSPDVVNQDYGFIISQYGSVLRVLNMETGKIWDDWFGKLHYPSLSSDSRFAAFLFEPGTFSSTYRLGAYDFLERHNLTLYHIENRASAFALKHNENSLIAIINEHTQNGIDKIVEYQLETHEKVPATIIEYPFREYEEYGRLNSVSISPDDEMILAGTDKGYLIAFDLDDKSIVYNWQAHQDSTVLAVDVSRDGRIIVSSSENGEVKIWATEPYIWPSNQ